MRLNSSEKAHFIEEIVKQSTRGLGFKIASQQLTKLSSKSFHFARERGMQSFLNTNLNL